MIRDIMTPEDTLTVSLEVSNTGKRPGSQVIQLYIHEQGVQFVSCPAFHEYLRENEPQWKQDFFDRSKTEFLTLMLPLPFYRTTEPLQGEPHFTVEQMNEIIKRCNRYVAEKTERGMKNE